MTDKGVLHGLDLFSGIGGITKALDSYVRPVAYCEIEPYARAVLLSRMHAGNLPLAPIWDDVLTLHGTMLPQVDIIYGGFPCQDLSVAGRGAGLEGKRSGLFFEIVRLVKEVRPAFIFLENVPAIRTRGLGIILKELAALRYDCRWGMLSASDVGANHKRERWFLLAHSVGANGGGGRIVGRGYDEGWENAPTEPKSIQSKNREAFSGIIKPRSKNVAHSHNSRFWINLPGRTSSKSGTRTPEGQATWWSVEPNVGRVANGVPKRVDRLRALGNAVVPAQAREAFERLMGLK